MPVTKEIDLYLWIQDGSNGTFSPVLKGDILLSINRQYYQKAVIV